MDARSGPIDAVAQAIGLLGGRRGGEDHRIRQAAWIARCVGRGDTAPLRPEDLTALAGTLRVRPVPGGAAIFSAGEAAEGVWIVRAGRFELVTGSGRRRAVVSVLRPGDVDGDLPMLLGRASPYTARALEDSIALHLGRAEFEGLLAAHPAIARRWLSSVAQRLAGAQMRVIALLGRSLRAQTARLLLDEADESGVHLPQRTLAAMLGVARQSLNKILKELEDEGAVTVRYGAIEIRDAGMLERAAG